MSYVNGRYVSGDCGSCEYWSEHKREGTCSQKIKTIDRILTNKITFHDDICTIYKEDESEYKINMFINKDGEIRMGGNYSKKSLEIFIEFLSKKIKEF